MHALAYHNGSGVVGRTPVFHAAPWCNAASIKGGPYTQGPFPTSGSTVVQQYGFVDFTDSGSSISIRMRGYDSTDVVRVDATLSFLTPPTVVAVGSIGTPSLPVHATKQPQALVG